MVMNIQRVFNQLPILESEELVLKKVELNNLEDVFAIFSNDQIFKYCSILPKHNIETVKSMIGHFERDYDKKSES
ncbi:hypothetical protein PAECIP111802_07410 [Paenibacillus allorhizosphaerae]|uniref:GNAT family N-acetyltransferase n=1 Tax=Paenibacillus allorhizosphaerae TaxID=2849866 RepID=A0ABN7TYT5_9BACL|nr:hypothetical protein PAECIP111802_07410 [Paenibacillus allorhizosphaerae]